MADAREDKQEHLRIYPFDLDGQEMLDIRFWRNTLKGPRPTRRGIGIKQNSIVQLIVGLQRIHAQINSEAAKKEAGV